MLYNEACDIRDAYEYLEKEAFKYIKEHINPNVTRIRFTIEGDGDERSICVCYDYTRSFTGTLHLPSHNTTDDIQNHEDTGGLAEME